MKRTKQNAPKEVLKVKELPTSPVDAHFNWETIINMFKLTLELFGKLVHLSVLLKSLLLLKVLLQNTIGMQ